MRFFSSFQGIGSLRTVFSLNTYGGSRFKRQIRLEDLFGRGVFISMLIWVVFGALPTLGLLAGELVTIVTGGEEPYIPPFGVFILPWWAAYPQTLLLLALTVISIPLPLKGHQRTTTRSVFLLIQVLSFSMLLWISTAVWASQAAATGTVNLLGLDYLILIQFTLICVTVFRMILSLFRLLPRKWRVYIDDNRVELSPTEVRQLYINTQGTWNPNIPWYGKPKKNQ